VSGQKGQCGLKLRELASPDRAMQLKKPSFGGGSAHPTVRARIIPGTLMSLNGWRMSRLHNPRSLQATLPVMLKREANTAGSGRPPSTSLTLHRRGAPKRSQTKATRATVSSGASQLRPRHRSQFPGSAGLAACPLT